MRAITTITSRAVPLPAPNIDTDQIIPGRFLTTTERSGLGRHLFADWRYDRDGRPRPDSVLDREQHRGAGIIVAGHNFGCGSSREHAVWALLDGGFQAVISSGFAEIFHGNALRNGLVAVTVEPAVLQELLGAVSDDPSLSVTIDLEALTLAWPGRSPISFPFDPFARHCITRGVDQLGYLLERLPAIEAYERCHPVRVSTGGGAL